MAESEMMSFDEVATTFADYGLRLRGLVRYQIIQRNLRPYLKGKKLRVLDVGGGSGPDAAMLVQLGHTVTMLEPSAEQREYAQRRFNFFLSDALRKKITICPFGLDELQSTKKFDLVLIHGVAMYQAAPKDFIAKAAAHVKRGGLLSLAEKGYYGAEARAIFTQNFEALRMLKANKRTIGNLGYEVHAFLPEDLEAILSSIPHMKILHWSGVRVVTDHLELEIKDVDSQHVQAVLDIEYEQGKHPAIRGQGQMLHYIVRKN